MKFDSSGYEESGGWRRIVSDPPPLNQRVRIAYIRFLDWNLYVMEFESEGIFRGDGKPMTIKRNKNWGISYDGLGKKLTHWKEL